ncbi:acyl-CoA desaturase [Legionella hackeliae]|uniref:Fatty acid desaturase family protein n=1 Tax=Legionella hackeliae TaxID=449 RepID=A0A0A8UUE8_LEGHA|nr:fatty acid desaturase [Legionella hackeliae]KTD09577.1 stearoyl CoA 9-desaturase [Legionella hackeliae]CEK11106.1 Fatty acid desaturase family protein [Legionella hackeliae]STX47858.1 stearoyl CoA 9-desaturase [Legionella hackeliae]
MIRFRLLKTKLHNQQALLTLSVVSIYWIYCIFWAPTIFIDGITPLSWAGMLLFFIVSCHITMIVISIYLHRSQTHRAVEFHPALRHFFRFWLFLTTGIVRSEWVAIHRAHHQNPDQNSDPHSPLNHGLLNMFLRGAEIYNQAKDPEIINKYGYVNDNDFLETYVYKSKMGPFYFLLIEIALFGLWGVVLWNLQMIFQIVAQTAFINGLGHHCGYRNFKTNDNSHNLTRWGILVAGEELHNNHHYDPAAVKFSYKKNEFDIGWFYINSLRKLKLAHLRKEEQTE